MGTAFAILAVIFFAWLRPRLIREVICAWASCERNSLKKLANES
jgi:hypothetical protein